MDDTHVEEDLGRIRDAVEFLERLLERTAVRTYRAVEDYGRAALAEVAPELLEQIAATSATAPQSYSKAHPASALLYCGIRLAERSISVRRNLVARGVLQVIKRIYDDEIAEVCGLGRHVMHRLAYLLLCRVSDCYNLSRTTLHEELRGDIITYTRRLDRRFFAPEMWEIRDD